MKTYSIDQVKLGIFEDMGELEKTIAARITKITGISRREISVLGYKITRESLDARKKNDIKRVFTVEAQVSLPNNPKKTAKLREASKIVYKEIVPMHKPKNSPVVCGFGPAGMFAALILAEAGFCPIVIERGSAMQGRVKKVDTYWNDGKLDEECNVQFGEGGAGAFSDGKLTTGIKDKRIGKVFDEFIEAGAPAGELIKQKPHLGTDRLRKMVPAIRKKIESLGGEVRFDTILQDLKVRDGKVSAVKICQKDSKAEVIPAEHVIMAMGHSARDTFEMLIRAGAVLEQKPFSIGLRIEHPQSLINRAQYGERWEEVAAIAGPAEYKLSHRLKSGKGVYTFCMCPGGEVVMSASEENTIVTNGMSNAARDGEFANAAILVDVRTDDIKKAMGSDVLSGAKFQKKYERLAYALGKGRAPKSSYADFKGSKLFDSLPVWCSQGIAIGIGEFGKRLKRFDMPDAMLTGVETRSSSPVRVLRGKSFESNIKGLYPAGEGAGYAGGITSSAVDGIKVAESILRTYADKRPL